MTIIYSEDFIILKARISRSLTLQRASDFFGVEVHSYPRVRHSSPGPLVQRQGRDPDLQRSTAFLYLENGKYERWTTS